MRKFITAKEWRRMTINEVLTSLETGLSVLGELPTGKGDINQLFSILEQTVTMVKKKVVVVAKTPFDPVEELMKQGKC